MTTGNDVLEQRLPDLPKDIGRLVFEHLASLGEISSALVSKEVQRWVEPIIYREISLWGKEQVELLHRTITTFASTPGSNKPIDFFQISVKLLSMVPGADLPHLALNQILHSCSSIESFALISATTGSGLTVEESSQLDPWLTSPKHIFMILFDVGTILFTMSFFKNVTHLELQSQVTGSIHWPELYFRPDGPSMPHLTHLSIGVHCDHDVMFAQNLGSVAREYASLLPAKLQVFLLVVRPDPGWDDFWDGIRDIARGEVDPRAVAVLDLMKTLPEGELKEGEEKMVIYDEVFNRGRWQQWTRLDTVDKGYWSRAEAIVDERKRKKESVRELKHS